MPTKTVAIELPEKGLLMPLNTLASLFTPQNRLVLLPLTVDHCIAHFSQMLLCGVK